MDKSDHGLGDDMMNGNMRHEFMEKDEIEKLISEGVPHNTQKKVKWAVKTFESWRLTRIVNRGDELNVYNSIDEMDRSECNATYISPYFHLLNERKKKAHII